MKARNLLGIVSLALAVTMTVAQAAESSPSKVIVVLADMSESTNKPEVRAKYLNSFRAILKETTHGDAIVVGLITEKSAMELSQPIQEEFPQFKPKMDTKIWRNAELKKADQELDIRKAAILDTMDKVVHDSSRKIIRTSVLSSLQVAERIFENYSQPRRFLVIFSDMLEDSDHYNFEKEKLTESRIGEIISKEKSANRIPGLKGVQVYVFGAFAPSLDQFYVAETFWMRYFKECGASLQKKDYGSPRFKFD